MIPKHESNMSPENRLFSDSKRRDCEYGVSEVLGVIMMLAMVVSIMGGVWLFLNPYISDFEDNTNWNSANGIADRLEDRIDVASDFPEGTGIRHKLGMRSSILQGVNNIEQWSMSADLTPNDVITIGDYTNTSFSITTVNNTAAKVIIETQNDILTQSLNSNSDKIDVVHNMQLGNWHIITILNETDSPIHRSIQYSISGLRVITSLGNGEHEIYLANNARIEHFADSAWDISQYPQIEFDELATGGVRLSMVLTNIEVNGSLGSSNYLGIDIISAGSINPFSGECYNIRFATSNSISPVIDPQYDDLWLTPYILNRAAGTLDSFVGMAPFERASGADGISVNSLGQSVFFDVTINQVVVEK